MTFIRIAFIAALTTSAMGSSAIAAPRVALDPAQSRVRGKRRDGAPEYSIVDVTRREELDGSGASGYSEVLEQYAALCGRPR